MLREIAWKSSCGCNPCQYNRLPYNLNNRIAYGPAEVGGVQLYYYFLLASVAHKAYDAPKPLPQLCQFHMNGLTEGPRSLRLIPTNLGCLAHGWKGSLGDEQKSVSKIGEVAGLLRTQTIHSLLGRNDWEASWARDDPRTGGG